MRPLEKTRLCVTTGFNPRTRVGCDKQAATTGEYGLFQSTHPCGVRLAKAMQNNKPDVSIHAPVWGATCVVYDAKAVIDVSIHAPVWGATLL